MKPSWWPRGSVVMRTDSPLQILGGLAATVFVLWVVL